MELREYRVKNKMTQAALAEELKDAYPRINVPLISLIERGVVDAPEAIKEWLAVKSVEELPPMDQVMENVLTELMIASAKNPVTRTRLKELTHECDRYNRLLIGELRDRGYWIVGGDANGYYMAQNRVELMGWMDTYTAYADTIMKRKARMLWRKQ